MMITTGKEQQRGCSRTPYEKNRILHFLSPALGSVLLLSAVPSTLIPFDHAKNPVYEVTVQSTKVSYSVPAKASSTAADRKEKHPGGTKTASLSLPLRTGPCTTLGIVRPSKSPKDRRPTLLTFICPQPEHSIAKPAVMHISLIIRSSAASRCLLANLCLCRIIGRNPPKVCRRLRRCGRHL